MNYLKIEIRSAEKYTNKARKIVEGILIDIRAIDKKFDKRNQKFMLSPEKKSRLIASVSKKTKQNIRFAPEQITAFAKAKRGTIKNFEMVTPSGIRAGQCVNPIDVAGCHVPGIRFAHTRSTFMSVVATTTRDGSTSTSAWNADEQAEV